MRPVLFIRKAQNITAWIAAVFLIAYGFQIHWAFRTHDPWDGILGQIAIAFLIVSLFLAAVDMYMRRGGRNRSEKRPPYAEP